MAVFDYISLSVDLLISVSVFVSLAVLSLLQQPHLP
jgi:hypothetical protein